MAILFGENKPATVNGITFSQSKQGYPVPVAMGQIKVAQCLIWMDGMQEHYVTQGGKGGGKGGDYLYSADGIAALCNGPVVSIGNVWSGQSWLSTYGGNESITVASVYAPQNAAVLFADNGVGLANTYSQTFTDFGAPASTVLSGTDYAPMQQVVYGTALTTGQYSINPASIGTFTVASCANASGGDTVYTGTFTGGTAPYTSGASNAYIGFAFIIPGFTTAANNGTFLCVASTATSVTLQNPNGVAETHTTTAKETGNTYHFAAADVGRDAIVNYQFSQQNFFASEEALITSGGSITVGIQYSPINDAGVWYYGNNTSIDGTRLTEVSGSPTAAGQYHVQAASGSNGLTYHFYTGSGGDLDKEVLITWKYTNNSAVTGAANTLLNFELFGGALGQAVAPYMLSGIETNTNGQEIFNPAFPSEALGYSNTAYVLYYPMELGSSAQVQDNQFEVLTPDGFGGGITDCNPITCVTKVLTNSVWGLGSGKTPFPVSCLDNGTSGTWGGPVGTPGSRSTANTAWNWFAANSFFISPYINSQSTASDIMGKWLEAGSVAAYMSEGLLKFSAYGTQSAAANGCTWTAPQTYVVALDDTCFVPNSEGKDPIKVERQCDGGYNDVQVTWKNRQNQYADEVTQESDQSAIDRWGLRREDPQGWDFITTQAAATYSANMRVKRQVGIRNTYTVTLPYSYSYLEPMDITPITTSSAWAAGLNNVNLGINSLPARITKIVDDPVKGLEVTFEDSLFPAGAPVIFNKQISTNYPVANLFADPGTSEVVMFEATSRLTKQQGNEIWIGAAGTSDDYGSTNVWVSQDGSKYLQVGTINAVARLGVLDSTFASGSDPDTVNSLIVDMVENTGGLEAGSATDADSGNTMCFVDGEIMSYSVCAISGQNQYTMNTYIRRGQMGSTISSHAAGTLFMRLDDAVFKYQYDPTWAGQALSFKFQPVNRFGNAAPDLSTLTVVSFTVPGANPGSIDASSGLVLLEDFKGTGYGPLGWAPVYGPSAVGPTFNVGSTGYSYSGMVTTYGSFLSASGFQYFYNRFTGYLIPSVTGEYTIGLNSDDGANLYIGGQQVGTDNLSANNQSMSGNLVYSSASSAKILLTKGVFYPIVIEWQQTLGNWGLQLLWTPPNSSTQVIPSGNLSISNTSITSTLNLTIWQGTSGLYYPSGTGLIDPANKTLYGPPTSGGGSNIVNGVVTSTANMYTGGGTAGLSYTIPGWIMGQLWTAGQQVCIIVPSTNINQGYFFNIAMNSSGNQCYIERYSGSSGTVGAAQTGTNGYVNYAPTNPGNITGWWNFAIYIGANGYKACWINGNLAADCTDLTYPTLNPATIYYGLQNGWGGPFKLAPAPNATGAGSTSLNPQGSIATISDYTLSYASTTSSITWSWGAFNIYCPDGSSYSVAASTGGATSISGSAGTSYSHTTPMDFTGLSSSTIYHFSPFVLLNSNGTGTVYILYTGTSAATLAQQVQITQGDGNVACSSSVDVTASTPSSGSGGGSGGGGGVSCFSPNTLVKTQRGDVAIIDIIVGEDKVLTARGTWKTVLAVTTRKWSGAMLDMGGLELSTPTHLVLEWTWEPMEQLNLFPTVHYEGTIHNLHVHCDADDDGTATHTEHSYTLANGLVVHNTHTSL